MKNLIKKNNVYLGSSTRFGKQRKNLWRIMFVNVYYQPNIPVEHISLNFTVSNEKEFKTEFI